MKDNTRQSDLSSITLQKHKKFPTSRLQIKDVNKTILRHTTFEKMFNNTCLDNPGAGCSKLG
jgi:hypothetical protein